MAETRHRTHPVHVWVTSALGLVERLVGPDPDLPLPHPPILIVGPPRSGTSLLQQVLVAGLDVGWFSGWHTLAAGHPALARRVWRTPVPVRFTSRYGTAATWREPHEAATWWYRFFPERPQAVTTGELDPADLDALRRSVASVLTAADRPVVWKNVVNSVRLDPLLDTLPEATVIVSHRPVVDTAASILAARAAVEGSESRWWSVEPADVDRLRGLDPIDQVLGQIRSVHRAIDSARAGRDPARWIDVEHADLLGDPGGVVDLVGEHLARRGHPVARRPVPDSFSPSGGDPDRRARVEARMAPVS